MKKLLITLGILLSPLWGYFLLYGGILWLLGYELTSSPTELAQRLVEEGRPARGCLLLKTLDLGPRPTTQELRRTCIFIYASLSEDPTACELLLPGEYGLACLSAVGGKLIGTVPCIKADGKTWVTCDGAGSEGFLMIDNAQIRNCDLYKRRDVREWCYTESTALLASIYHCGSVTMPSMKDKCEMRYAFKQKDPLLCAAVKDEKRRKYCEIRINTWLKYPELRDSFYFGKPVPIDAAAPSR